MIGWWLTKGHILPEIDLGYIFKHLIWQIFRLGGYSEQAFLNGASL